jgi:hypothetical protein
MTTLNVTLTNVDTGAELSFNIAHPDALVDPGFEVLLPLCEHSTHGDLSFFSEITVEGRELSALASIDHKNDWAGVQFFDHTEASPDVISAILSTLLELV